MRHFRACRRGKRRYTAMRRVIAVILSLAAIGAYRQAGAQTNTSGTDGFQFVDETGTSANPPTFEIHISCSAHSRCLTPRETKYTHLRDSRHSGSVSPHWQISDGTVLVKEVFGTEQAQMTTGDANWASGTKVWFVLIKDAKGRYPGNPILGDGGVGHFS